MLLLLLRGASDSCACCWRMCFSGTARHELSLQTRAGAACCWGGWHIAVQRLEWGMLLLPLLP